MKTGPNIETREQLIEWAKLQNREICITIALRSSLRVLPILLHGVSYEAPNPNLVLCCLRALMLSATWVHKPSQTLLENAEVHARASIALIRNSVSDHNFNVVYASMLTASNIYDGDYQKAFNQAEQAASDAGFSFWQRHQVEEADFSVVFTDTAFQHDNLLYKPIWLSVGEPLWLARAFTDQPSIFDLGDDWSFWREWYQGFLDGKPMDWEFQRRVALIDDAVWEAGPEAVAKEIEQIRAAFEVETRATELEQSAHPQSFVQPERGIGDNNPPSSIEDALTSSDGVTIIWAAAQELKQEAQSEQPRKGNVRKAVSALVGVLKSFGLWTAQKLDKGLDAAIIAGCAAGSTAGVAWITQNTDKIQELIEAAQKWLPFL